MPRGVQRLHRFRIFVHPFAHHEEGGFELVFVKDLDELLGILVAPGGVEAQGADGRLLLDAVNGQLPQGGCRWDASGRNTGNADHQTQKRRQAGKNPLFVVQQHDLHSERSHKQSPPFSWSISMQKGEKA